MKIKKLLNSMNGFSLVEMTVVLALMGAAAVGVMKMTETANKAGKNIETKDEISQLNNRINDILKNPTNCLASLGDRTLNSTVPIINQVINTQLVHKYTAEGASPANPNKISIDSMIITAIDSNGSDGSQALATLRVGYRKPKVGAIGGQVLNKDILINANLCLNNPIFILTSQPISALTSQCGTGKRLIDGPHTWGGYKWAQCQDCINAITLNTIRSCQSQGSGGGVDISSLTELTCATQGGVWDNLTSSCDTGNASCTALGGIYDATSNTCTAITSLVASLPQCILSQEACTGLYPNNTSNFDLINNLSTSVTTYTRSCYTEFTRKGNACCVASYNAYGHYNSGSCSVGSSTNPNATCGQNGGDSTDHSADCRVLGVGWAGQCFTAGSPQCTTTSTGTQVLTSQQNITLKKCCRL